MSTRKLCNVTLADYRDFLAKAGCRKIRTQGGHEIWAKSNLTRPIVVQTHETPVPEFIIKNALRDLGLNKSDFFEILFECPTDRTNEEDISVDMRQCLGETPSKKGKKKKK